MSKIYYTLLLVFYFVSAMQSQIIYYGNESVPCYPKVFHVSVHIVVDQGGVGSIESEELEDDFELLNAFFEPLCWSFEMCKQDTIIDHSFTLLNRNRYTKLHEYYNDDHMVNLYYVSSASFQGFCHLAPQNGIEDPTSAYVVMGQNCLNNDLIHKFCHMFGLTDTYNASSPELVNGGNCTVAGDGLCSTPADPYNPNSNIGYVNTRCQYISEIKDANGEYYEPMVGNMMSSYRGCRDGLTVEQYRTMLDTYLTLTYTPW